MGTEIENTNGRERGSWMELANRLLKDPGFDVTKIDGLERVLAMHERQLLLQATEEAADAMTALQRELNPVTPNAKNAGLNNKRYANIAAVYEEIQPLYTKYGFSVSFSEEPDPRPEWIHYSATVMRGRWSRTSHLYAKRDATIKGNRTQMQESGSNSTYMRRYLLCMCFNIITAEDVQADNDGSKLKPSAEAEIKRFLDDLSADCKAVQNEEEMDTLLRDGKLLKRLDRLREEYKADWKTAQEIIAGMRARLAPHITRPSDDKAGEHLV